MKIAILGTRGIPNFYGGFEQFAEYLSLGLIKKGHKVAVFNSHNHPYQEKVWQNVEIVHCYDPENKLGTLGQFIYDFNCIVECRKRDFDLILQLGYTSSSVWGWLLPRKKSIIITNMDGLEWKRSKFSKPVQYFLQFAERLAIQYSNYWIADSIGIKKYLAEKYNVCSTYIPYGADIFNSPNTNTLLEFKLEPFKYDMLIARLEPENSIETILDGINNNSYPFLVIGKYETKYGKFLKTKYINSPNIRFLGGIFDMNKLNNLRFHSNLYFHGHTVGGTNPSLLEAMASNSLICAHDNIFNKSILGEDAFYFSTQADIKKLLQNKISKQDYSEIISNNRTKTKELYSWKKIITDYEIFFLNVWEKNLSKCSIQKK